MTNRMLSRIDGRSLSAVLVLIALALACPQARAGGVVSACNEPGLKAALFGGGAVTFSCSGTITVLGGTILVSADTSIDGSGQNVTVSGGGKVQVFVVNSGVTLSLNNITVADGIAGLGGAGGAGILNNGTVNVTNCTFQGNTGTPANGGGIYNNGELTVTNCSFNNNSAGGQLGSLVMIASGGGIYNNGDLTVTNSTFQGNKSYEGGGISSNGGSLQVANSVFYNNSGLVGGGIYNRGSNANGSGVLGGRIFNPGSNASVLNSTFSGNLGSSIYNDSGGTAILTNTTLANTGTADSPNVVNLGTLTLQDTILRGAGSGGVNCSGSVIDGGGNLRWPISDSSCVGSYGNPVLGILENNGGPTWTMALRTGSAAIGTAFPSLCPSTDQRGYLRPSHCSIGAYEAVSPFTMVMGSQAQFIGFQTSLLFPIAVVKLRIAVIEPLTESLNPNLWLGSDGNHLNPQLGSQVFTLHRAVVDRLSEFIVDSKQLIYINNLVAADRTLAAVAINDKGCATVSSPTATAPPSCTQAVAELAAGDTSAGMGEYGQAIAHYGKAWQATSQ